MGGQIIALPSMVLLYHNVPYNPFLQTMRTRRAQARRVHFLFTFFLHIRDKQGGSSMASCFLSIHKVHDKARMGWLEKHMRCSNTPADKNIESTCSGLNYWDAIQKRIRTLSYYDSHKVRRNAVLAYSIYLTCSQEAEVDLQGWVAANLAWLHNAFDRAPDGVSNILEVIYHTAPAPHLHALVIPIDPRGHLCASFFTNGSIAMAQLQASYARQMQSLSRTV